MTYPELLALLEAAAITADADCSYIRGRFSDISRESVGALIQDGKNGNLIYAEDTMQISSSGENATEEWRLTLGFLRQDSTSSAAMERDQQQPNEESREVLFDKTSVIAKRFLSALYNEDSLQILNASALKQVTRVSQSTMSGWACDMVVIVGGDCIDISIQDAIYQNAASAPTFQQSIKRGEVYTAPKITVTDSDGSTFEQPANENVVCTFIPGGSCTYPVKVNGVLYGTITVNNCEEININISA